MFQVKSQFRENPVLPIEKKFHFVQTRNLVMLQHLIIQFKLYIICQFKCMVAYTSYIHIHTSPLFRLGFKRVAKDS